VVIQFFYFISYEFFFFLLFGQKNTPLLVCARILDFLGKRKAQPEGLCTRQSFLQGYELEDVGAPLRDGAAVIVDVAGEEEELWLLG